MKIFNAPIPPKKLLFSSSKLFNFQLLTFLLLEICVSETQGNIFLLVRTIFTTI